MIEEAYCSFEVAKLLKEKGFPMREHSMMYTNKNNVCLTESAMRQHLSREDYLHFEDFFIPTITYQMAMKWLREKHNLFIFPFPQINTNKFWAEIYQLSDSKEWKNLYCESIDLQNYPSYEESVEAALKYCLEHLI